MSDTAAFFANKKKKKKAFKFNANLVDASSVAATAHIDAPALSTDHDPNDAPAHRASEASSASAPAAAAEQWDDEALAVSIGTRKASTAAASTSGAEVLDMKSLEISRKDDHNIAEKLRVQETKAQLAAAREGMERQAAKLKEEKEMKEAKKTAVAPRFTAAAGRSGGTWVAPHLRAGAGGSLARRLGGSTGVLGQKLDVQDEQLFPDLAAAGKILEQKEKEQQHLKAPKKTPVGGGATWASKKALPKKEESKDDPGSHSQSNSEVPEPQVKAVPTATPVVKPVVSKPTKEKKKKKDLSTFKPTSS